MRETPNQFRVLVSRDGRDGSVRVHQDATLSGAWLTAGAELVQLLARDRQYWLQVAEGSIRANGQPLAAGDGLALTGAGKLELSATEGAEVLLFDLAR